MLINKTNLISNNNYIQKNRTFTNFKGRLKSDSFDFSNSTKEQQNKIVPTKKSPLKNFFKLFSEKIIISKELKGQRIAELTNSGIEQEYIKNFAKLNETQYEKVLKLAKNGVKSNCIETLLKLEESQFRNAVILANAGVNSYYINQLSSYNGTEFEYALKLAKAGIDVEVIKYILNLNNTKKVESAIKLANAGIKSHYILDFIDLDKTKFERTLKLAENGIKSRHISNMTDLEPTQFSNVIKLKKLGIKEDYIVSLSTENIDEVISLFNKNVGERNIKPLLALKKVQGTNVTKAIDNVNSLKAKALEHPELYVNGEFEQNEDEIKVVNSFFQSRHYMHLIKLSECMDKEAMNTLLRMRFDDAGTYLNIIDDFDNNDLKLLKDLCSSATVNNKPITAKQKIEFIDLIVGYKTNDLTTKKIQSMIKTGNIDISELNMDLLKNILKSLKFSDKELNAIPVEKLNSWDLTYIPLLSKEITNSLGDTSAISNILEAANLNDFRTYIQDTSNKYGKINNYTKLFFEFESMNYEKWLNPSKSNEIQFIAKDKNKEQLSKIAGQIAEDVEVLRQTPAKDFINKQLSKYIKDDKFSIPEEYTTSKAKLAEFTENVQKQFESIFKRAQNNLNNPEKALMAQNTLTIQNHLKQRLSDIKRVSDIKSNKTMDVTIKMWDRIPQKDLFQGNYSTCCIGMGEINSSAMSHYLLDTAYNMIELKDNKTGKIIGNALCYFAKDSKKNTIFVIDNIEIKNSEIPSDTVGVQLRNSIAEYATNVAHEVTGKNDIKICMGAQYNDVSTSDLTRKIDEISFLGDIDDSVYMDLYNGWIDRDNLTKPCEFFELNP